MRCFFLSAVFVLLYKMLGAQNLVPNPGFEELNTPPPCWTSGNREDFPAYVRYWITPNMGTTDLLTTSVPDHCITAMPNSTYPAVEWFPRGSQIPRSGNNFAGIKPYYNDRREYLEVKLVCPLIPGEEYYAEMYVSLSENTNYAQNSLGMYFSDTLVYTDSYSMLEFSPQIVEKDVITDSLNWIRISGTFIAGSPAEYLIIGNFSSEVNTERVFLGDKGGVAFPYYFIDDISVQLVNPPELEIAGDTVVCKGDEVQLEATGWPGIRWYSQDGELLSSGNTLTYTPSIPGPIKAETRHCNLNLSKSAAIHFAPAPVVDLGPDTLICEGTSVTLDAGVDPLTYQWQNGSGSRTYTASAPGIYSVSVKNTEGCSVADEIEIGFYKAPEAKLGEDLITCEAAGTLNAFTPDPQVSYLWQDSSTAMQFEYHSPGVYWVTVRNICGTADTDSIRITKIEPFIPNLITANGDGKNDSLVIPDTTPGKGMLWIYNRNGSPVYRNEKYRNDFTGDGLSEGIYFYLFSYPSCPDLSGWLQILR